MQDNKIQEAIKSGGDATLFRPPYGGTFLKKGEVFFDGRIKKEAEALGKRVCTWTIDTRDWEKPSAAVIDKRVLDSVKPGSVVLMHMLNKSNSLAALPAMIEGIRSRGLELCKIQPVPTTSDIPATLPC